MVLASGSGSNFQAILNAIDSGSLDASVSHLIASKPGIGAIQIASGARIPVSIMSARLCGSPAEFEKQLLQLLKDQNPALIVLAGWLLKIPSGVIQHFEGKIINIHPSLLPDYGGQGFYGIRVHQAVISDRRRISGCTVHLVTEEFDEGPVIARKQVPVYPEDSPETLASRVLEQEHQLLPATIQKLLHP